MPLGTEINIGSGDVMLDGVGAPHKTLKGAQPSAFGSCLLWPNGWMDEDATWYGSRSRPRPHCVSQLARDRDTAAPSFRSMSIVAMVAHLSYTAELLYSVRSKMAYPDITLPYLGAFKCTLIG